MLSAVTTAFISACTALIGILIGQVLSRENEYRKWLRSELHGVCAEMLEAAEAAYTTAAMDSAIRGVISRKAENLDLRTDPANREMVRQAASEILGRPIGANEVDGILDQIESSGTFRNKLRSGFLEKHDPGLEKWLTAFTGSQERVQLALAKVRLICAPEVVAAAERLRDKTLDVSHNSDINSDEWTTKSGAYQRTRNEYVAAARSQLVNGSRSKAFLQIALSAVVVFAAAAAVAGILALWKNVFGAESGTNPSRSPAPVGTSHSPTPAISTPPPVPNASPT
jgi:hypothetical protein